MTEKSVKTLAEFTKRRREKSKITKLGNKHITANLQK